MIKLDLCNFLLIVAAAPLEGAVTLVTVLESLTMMMKVLVCYRGKNNGDSHFDLTAPNKKGLASLHCFLNSHFMEGYWQEGDVRGGGFI